MQLLSAPDPAIRLKVGDLLPPALARLSDCSQTLCVLSSVDLSIVQQYYTQRLRGLDRSSESYEDEVLALLEVVKILAAEDAEFYARSVRDVLSPAEAVPSGQRSSQVLERAVENVLSSFRDGEFVVPLGVSRSSRLTEYGPGDTTFGEQVATMLLTPLAEVEADTAFSPTLMVVLTALACEYAGRVPVSPLQLLCGLSKRLLSYSGSLPVRGTCPYLSIALQHQSRRFVC
jgi:AP-4 complex subunit epsilon-1